MEAAERGNGEAGGTVSGLPPCALGWFRAAASPPRYGRESHPCRNLKPSRATPHGSSATAA
uniref:Uncharacterized protein n=1 Tax=Leersia perrieri TaxID=77586 RepID=A0A0D9UXD9_9ORYZ